MTFAHSNPHDIDKLPNIEVFHCPGATDELEPGWYWWACFPGCLPDSDPHGPFQSERDATLDAQDGDYA